MEPQCCPRCSAPQPAIHGTALLGAGTSTPGLGWSIHLPPPRLLFPDPISGPPIVYMLQEIGILGGLDSHQRWV